jgi:hypothetical protein
VTGESSGWDRLLHAYGPASGTPAHLRALEGSDDAAVDRALDHLWSAVLHQGSIYPATAPVVAWLCAALRDGRLHERASAAAVEFVAEAFRSANAAGDVAEPPPERLARLDRAIAAYDEDELWGDDELVNDLMVRAVLELRAVAPLAVEVAERAGPALAPALDLLVQATRSVPGADLASAIDALSRAADGGTESVKVTAVLGLGELGVDTAPYLSDEALAVRVAAALAPAVVSRRSAQDVLRDAAMRPEELDAAFDPRPPQLDMHARFYVIDALCRHATDFGALLPAALACLPQASEHTVEYDWGRFLVTAQHLHPDEMTDAKRTYLKALVRRRDLWNPRNGNAHFLFEDAGLPYDRRACARLA